MNPREAVLSVVRESAQTPNLYTSRSIDAFETFTDFLLDRLATYGYQVVAMEHTGLSPRTAAIIDLGDAYDQLLEKTNFTKDQAFELLKAMYLEVARGQ